MSTRGCMCVDKLRSECSHNWMLATSFSVLTAALTLQDPAGACCLWQNRGRDNTAHCCQPSPWQMCELSGIKRMKSVYLYRPIKIVKETLLYSSAKTGCMTTLPTPLWICLDTNVSHVQRQVGNEREDVCVFTSKQQVQYKHINIVPVSWNQFLWSAQHIIFHSPQAPG